MHPKWVVICLFVVTLSKSVKSLWILIFRNFIQNINWEFEFHLGDSIFTLNKQLFGILKLLARLRFCRCLIFAWQLDVCVSCQLNSSGVTSSFYLKLVYLTGLHEQVWSWCSLEQASELFFRNSAKYVPKEHRKLRRQTNGYHLWSSSWEENDCLYWWHQHACD